MDENEQRSILQDANPPLETPAELRARILLVEDDESVSRFLKDKLESDHFAVHVAANAADARRDPNLYQYELVILDLILPGASGLELLKAIRSESSSLPILVLTARAQIEDRVQALDLGADDYLVKPFEYDELAARIRALRRRAHPPQQDVVWRFEDLELNRVDRTLKRSGRPIELTPKEYALLEYLMLNPGRCLTRAMIMEQVWKLSLPSATNVVDVYINYLRNKIDRDFDHKLIQTVRGAGYQLAKSQ